MGDEIRGCEDPTCTWCHPELDESEENGEYDGDGYHDYEEEEFEYDEDDELTQDDKNHGLTSHGGRGPMGHTGQCPFDVIEDPLEIMKRMQHHSSSRAYDIALTTWDVDNLATDPVQGAADFYLLMGIEIDALNGGNMKRKHRYMKMICDETASHQLNALVERLFPILYRYCDMALGGELRHHRRLGGTCMPGPSSRDGAWIAWKHIRDKYGTEALHVGKKLFLDFHSSSYGGKAWAKACDVLIAYEEGQFNELVFLDRVFDLEHNGGIFLNKVQWKLDDHVERNFGVQALKRYIGPAHSAEPTDWPILYHFASKTVKKLWHEYFEMQNAFRKEEREKQIPAPRMNRYQRREFGLVPMCKLCGEYETNHYHGCQNHPKNIALAIEKQKEAEALAEKKAAQKKAATLSKEIAVGNPLIDFTNINVKHEKVQ